MRLGETKFSNGGELGVICKYIRVDPSGILCTMYNMYMDA